MTTTRQPNTADPPVDRAHAIEHRKTAGELARIVADALAFSPPLYFNSILGMPWTWIPPYRGHSEFRIFSPFAPGRFLNYVADVTIPALPVKLPEDVPLSDAAAFRPTRILFQPDHHDDPYSFRNEAWIFINGIATNPDMARINADYIAALFSRPLTIIQNATDSIGVDLLESVVGKSWQVMTEASARAYPFILHALRNERRKRVVVICHSQGTIIMSNVLRALVSEDFRRWMLKDKPILDRLLDHPEKDGLKDLSTLAKLEIYAFANCADVMAYAPPQYRSPSGHRVPLIENFGNEYDLVARTGMLAPHAEKHGIVIDGPRFVREGMWGHLLNEHYLMGIEPHLRAPDKFENPYRSDSVRPRLYDYFEGGTPPPY